MQSCGGLAAMQDAITRDARRNLLHLFRMSVIQSSSMPQNLNLGDLIRLNMWVLCWPVMELTTVSLKLADSLLASSCSLEGRALAVA
jgi:hypothetical protein